MVHLHTLIKQAKSTCIDKHRGKKTINENKQNIYENKIKPPPFLSVEYRNVKLDLKFTAKFNQGVPLPHKQGPGRRA